MATAPLVQANGASLPSIGLGTWPLKGEECAQAVRTAIEAGYRHIDTAAMYGNEADVGAGLRAAGLPRDSVFVTTKVWRDDIAPGDLERSAEASLTRLGLSSVDLLLIHWLNDDIPLRGPMAALCRAKRLGLARHIGVSNFPSAMLDEAVGLANEPLVTNQVEYHPNLDQSVVMAACRRHGLALTSYAPLGRTGLVHDERLKPFALKHAKTPAQILLRWHVQQPGVVAIPKSANPKRIAENIDIFDFALDGDEMAALSAFARPDGRVVDLAFAPRWDEPAAARTTT